MTAGMATNRPMAVVTSASEIPPATAARPVAFCCRNALEGVQNADHRAEQSDERSRRADGGQTAQAALQFGVHDGFGALQSALGGFDGLARDFAGLSWWAWNSMQASGDNLGQVALLVALGNLDGFVDLAIAQRAGHGRSKRARLLAGGAEGHPAVDHDADRPARHDEQNDDHDLRQDIPSDFHSETGSQPTWPSWNTQAAIAGTWCTVSC